MATVLSALPSTAARTRLARLGKIETNGVWLLDERGGLQPAQVLMHVTTMMLQSALRRQLSVLVVEVDGAEHPIITGVVGDVTPAQALVDGQRIEITGEREVVLRCGKASITLTRGGQIELRGEFIRSQANGPQVIQGATVDIN